MLGIRTTEVFDVWLEGLRDRIAKRRIQARIDRLALGNPGDTNSAGAPITEMRIDHGPGYRIYYQQCGAALIVLLCAGDKGTQSADIRTAARVAQQWSSENG